MNFNDSLSDHVDTFLAALRRHEERRTTSGPNWQPGPIAAAPARTMESSVWLTVEEAVLYLGLRTRMALYQAVRRGQVPVHHLGRRLRFRRSELDAALARR